MTMCGNHLLTFHSSRQQRVKRIALNLGLKVTDFAPKQLEMRKPF